jgi:hypothetical protein
MITDELVLAEAVAAGADFMDAIDVGITDEAERWYWVVDPDTLDMTDGRRCVAGQFNGSAGNRDRPGFHLLGLSGIYETDRVAFNMAGAFHVRTVGLRLLTALWVEAIDDRRAAWFDRHPEAVLA